MKPITLFLFALILSSALMSAQSTSQTETVDDRVYITDAKKDRTSGCYLSVATRYSTILKESSAIATVNLAYVKLNKIELGLSGTGFISDRLEGTREGRSTVYGAYGGIFVAPIIPIASDLSITLPMRTGFGAATYDRDNFTASSEEIEFLVVLEPGVTVDYQVAKWVKVGAEATYRITNDIEFFDLDIKNLNGFSAGISLKFGLM